MPISSAKWRVVAFDSETWRIAPGRVAPKPVCWTFAESADSAEIYNCDDGIRRLEAELDRTDTILVAHNLPFDLATAIATKPSLLEKVFAALEAGRLRCTQIREMLDKIALGEFQADPDDNYRPATFNLAACIRRRFGVDISEGKSEDAWRTKYFQLDGLAFSHWPADALNYALDDAKWAFRLFSAQSVGAYYDSEWTIPTLRDEIPQVQASMALHLMQCWGLRANRERVNKLRSELIARCEAAYSRLLPIGVVYLKREKGETKYSTRQKTLQEMVQSAYIAEGKAPPRTPPSGKFPEGQIQISEDALSTTACRDAFGRILKPGDAGRCNDETGHQCASPLHWYADISEDKGELSKYVAFLEDGADFPLNVWYSPLVATGRTAARNPPIQQLPRRVGIRECLEPRLGNYYIGCDYSANELVTLAQILIDLFGRSDLADIIRSGKDPHLVTAALILGISYDDAVTRLKLEKAHYKIDKHAPRPVTDARQLSKALNFGLPGGMGAAKFVLYAWKSWKVRITEEQAREYKKQWFGWYPEVSAYQQIVGDYCAQGGDRFTLIQPRTGRIRGNVGFCDGCNSQFQGLAADMTKRALWRVTKEAYTDKRSPLYGTRPVIFNHDEIISEAQWSIAAPAADRLAQIMIETGQALCPDVPVTAEPWVSTVWSKEVKSTRINGILQVWSPDE